MRVTAGVVALLLLWGAGCGDDSEGDGTTPADDGGMDASTEDAGDSGSTPPPPPTPPPSFMCGELTCVIPGQDLVDLFATLGFPRGAVPFSPCCTDDDQCGIVTSNDAGAECVPRPPSDPVCPDVDIFGVLQPGCCIEDMGVCGVNAAQVGAGCLDATGGLGPLFGIEPLPCDDADAGVDDDDGDAGQ